MSVGSALGERRKGIDVTKLLEGKVAIITGAGSGVGLAVARRFFEEGASVMLADLDEEKAVAEAAEIDPERKRAFGFRCDPTKRLDINNLMAATLDAFDHVEILVNATMVEHTGEPLEIDETVFDRAIDVNLKSAFLLIQLFAKYVIKRVEAMDEKPLRTSVINVSALSVERVRPDRFMLGVSMAAVDQMTRGFAVSLAEWGIRVNGIAPGSVTGRFSATNDAQIRKSLVARTPMARLAEPTEVAGVAVMLATDHSSYITGQILVVDGGRSIYEQPLPIVDDEKG